MPLTQEQKERMLRSKERALQIRQKRLLEQQLKKEEGTTRLNNYEQKKQKVEKLDELREEDVVLEDFELCASEHVSKREAKEIYCLPEGTLAICSYVEKENPFRKGFSNMKLYKRNEIRRFARERFGGLEGLVAEREKRERKRYARDLEDTKNTFK